MILQQHSNQRTLTISMVSLRKNSTDEFTEGKQTKMLILCVFYVMWKLWWHLFDENFCYILWVSILLCNHLILHWKLINYLKIIIAVITHNFCFSTSHFIESQARSFIEVWLWVTCTVAQASEFLLISC